MKRKKRMIVVVVGLLCGAQSPGCGDDGSESDSYITADKDAMSASAGDTGVFGSVVLSINPGAGVPALAVGEGPGLVVDGWEVEYSKFLVSVGDFRATVNDPTNGVQETIGDGSAQIVDMLALPDEGALLRGFDRVAAGTTSEVGFSLVQATLGAESIGVSSDDYDVMVKNEYTIYVEGTIRNPAGQTCTPGVPDECKPAPQITFRWGLQLATMYDECAEFEVVDAQPTEVELRLPADRWFRTDLSDRRTPYRAQWIADADLDRDGETTLAELEATAADDVFPGDRYDLNRASAPITTARQFLEVQARAIGSVGLGRCASTRAL